MSYINKEDMNMMMRDHILDAVLNSEDLTFDNAVEAAVSQVKQYLYNRYDVAQIFAQTGNERHPHLKRIIVIITRYILLDRVVNKDSGRASKSEKDYDDALEYLKDIRSGLIDADLPRLNNENGEPKTLFRAGGDPPRRYL